MNIRYLLFDLDDTLYPRSAGVMQNISRLIRQYIVEQLGYTPKEAQALTRRYYRLYGASMRGLILHHSLDADHFLHYVHNFPLEELLAPNPQLDALLAALPTEKVIFTNADRAHAERVLSRLGVERRFSHIIDVTAVGYISKPAPEAYVNCLRLLQAQPAECVLIDDSVRNLQPAIKLGMAAVLVDGNGDAAIQHHIANILELGPAIEAICREQNC